MVKSWINTGQFLTRVSLSSWCVNFPSTMLARKPQEMNSVVHHSGGSFSVVFKHSELLNFLKSYKSCQLFGSNLHLRIQFLHKNEADSLTCAITTNLTQYCTFSSIKIIDKLEKLGLLHVKGQIVVAKKSLLNDITHTSDFCPECNYHRIDNLAELTLVNNLKFLESTHSEKNLWMYYPEKLVNSLLMIISGFTCTLMTFHLYLLITGFKICY